MTVTIANDGTAAAHVGTPSLVGTNAGDFLVVAGRRTNCAGATLSVGATCTIQVAFRPTATGSRSASLFIPSDTPASPTLVPLTGTGA